MQGSSFLRPDPTASSPTRMRLAPLQHSPSANAARVHVPTQSEVNARLGGSFSVFNQYATKNLSAMMLQMMERAVTEQPADMNQFMIDFLLEHGGGGGGGGDDAAISAADLQKLQGENEGMLGEYAALSAELSQVKAQLPAASQLSTTLAIIKPDAVAAGATDAVLAAIEQDGFDVVRRLDLRMSLRQAQAFYAEHEGKPFFANLCRFMSSGPAVVLQLERLGAVWAWRSLIGPTATPNAKLVAPQSLRARFGTDGTRNACHGAANAADAEREVSFFFGGPVEDTLAMIKPCSSCREEEIVAALRAADFQVVARVRTTLSKKRAEAFYAEHEGRPFFGGLVDFMSSGPVVALWLRREDGIKHWRRTIGPTDSNKARAEAPRSLRARYGTDGRRNALHGSDSDASAQRELKFWFGARPVVFSGPSGAGKSTVIGKLMEAYPGKFGFSVSHTTREPRAGEVDGVHYHFVGKEEIQAEIGGGGFVEHALVHGNYYGTSFRAVRDVSGAGKICLLDIDKQGVQNVKEQGEFEPYYVFVRPPSLAALEKRLRARGTETERNLQLRLNNAAGELAFGAENGGANFDLTVVNDDLEVATAQLIAQFQQWFAWSLL